MIPSREVAKAMSKYAPMNHKRMIAECHVTKTPEKELKMLREFDHGYFVWNKKHLIDFIED